MKQLVSLALVFLLAACGSSGTPVPPNRDKPVEVEILRVRPLTAVNSQLHTDEIQIRMTLTNTTPGSMWILPGDFAYDPASSVGIEGAATYTSTGNYSYCSDGPVAENHSQTCSLIFEWSDAHPQDRIVPGTLTYRNSGYSQVAGEVWIENWAD